MNLNRLLAEKLKRKTDAREGRPFF